MKQCTFIVVAAGSGKRFGFKKNKMLYPIKGRPLICLTLDTLQGSKVVNKIVLVSKKREIPAFKKIIEENGYSKIVAVIPGGEKRQDSVYNALRWVNKNFKKDLFIGIHDGARVNVNLSLIQRVFKKALQYNAAVPALISRDTIKRISKEKIVQKTLNRDEIGFVQTPQIFLFSLLWNAYQKACKEGFYATDDAALLEHYGEKVSIVPGDEENTKITFLKDLAKLSPSRFRIGTGFDVHPLVKGRTLYLGGIKIPSLKGLKGHSDGDVVIHAIIDALLGACGMPDIGMLFPDTDKKYKNISSLLLLESVIKKIEQDGFRIVNVDTVIIADRPKISFFKSKMIKKLSAVMNISPRQVNIKGKRTEGVVFKNGIASLAITLVEA
ncbi:MAG: 2-C-methyl-D-erythritol 4-phosphate cytidylyltransferase [Spirochaetes bacterium]|nr:2-C-methyl-D-erythritol 4-phosphate cytidylyltransferase [Spirochaetota bacterium]